MEKTLKDRYTRLKQLLNESELESVLQNMAKEIHRLVPEPESLLLVGMASRGIPLAERIASKLEVLYGRQIPCGQLDASFYRDDFHSRTRVHSPEVRITSMPPLVENSHIVLIDDVLYTGRSVRAALESIMDMGRPRAVRLAVLIDRGHRELPIAPDMVGVQVCTESKEEVRVLVKEIDGEDAAWLVAVEDF